ncbi:hypothetical protein M8C21_016792 [Ambrosia artemisiifolia]|uniref:Uncharacterized protein n=1 Tax=Ambrosia artemisiifolia TaxID=4212 RepID=A0AAD5D4S9_AMBAR|nr:hypothetical protein M8C21_016792 [Ambrosia artemisiifolia]
MSLEELLPAHRAKSRAWSIFIRTGLVMSLVGSLLTMLVTLILPCVCFLSILKGNITRFQGSFCVLIIIVGVMSSAIGTYMSISEIIHQLS